MPETEAGQGTSTDERTEAAVAVLGQDVGTWDAEIDVQPWPGAALNSTTGVRTNGLVGGRWLVSNLRTDSGFEGHGVYGWDPTHGHYAAAWVDAAGGAIARGHGTWDETARTMTYELEVEHQGKTIRYREVTEAPDDRTRLYRNLRTGPDGTEFEAIRATYRRR
jgi:hypothetical protein